MKKYSVLLAATFVMIVLIFNNVSASEVEDYSSTINLYRQSPQVQPYFEDAYGYAVFPTVGKAAFGVGGSYGKGQVYRGGVVTCKTSLIEVSVGFQAGGQAFSQIMFFQDKRAYDEFTSGQFEFDAQASAVAVTAGAQAQAGTTGATASASAGPRTGSQAETYYYKGIVVFVHAKGGLMFEAAIAGQKFNTKPLL